MDAKRFFLILICLVVVALLVWFIVRGPRAVNPSGLIDLSSLSSPTGKETITKQERETILKSMTAKPNTSLLSEEQRIDIIKSLTPTH